MNKQDSVIINLIEAQIEATIRESSFHDFMTGLRNVLINGQMFGRYSLDETELGKIFGHVDAIVDISKDNNL